MLRDWNEMPPPVVDSGLLGVGPTHAAGAAEGIAGADQPESIEKVAADMTDSRAGCCCCSGAAAGCCIGAAGIVGGCGGVTAGGGTCAFAEECSCGGKVDGKGRCSLMMRVMMWHAITYSCRLR